MMRLVKPKHHILHAASSVVIIDDNHTTCYIIPDNAFVLILGVDLNFSSKEALKRHCKRTTLSLQSKTTNNAKSEVRFKQLIRDLRSQSTLQR
jgi:hypothetical protein